MGGIMSGGFELEVPCPKRCFLGAFWQRVLSDMTGSLLKDHPGMTQATLMPRLRKLWWPLSSPSFLHFLSYRLAPQVPRPCGVTIPNPAEGSLRSYTAQIRSFTQQLAEYSEPDEKCRDMVERLYSDHTLLRKVFDDAMCESEHTRATRRRRRWNRRQGREASSQAAGELFTRCGSPEPRPPPLWGRAVLQLATGRTYEQLAAELQAEQPGLAVADFGAILRQQHRREAALAESAERDDGAFLEEEEESEEEDEAEGDSRRVLQPLRAARRRAKDVAMAVLDDEPFQPRSRRLGSQKRSASRDPSLARQQSGKRRRDVSVGTELRERLAVLNLRTAEAP